MSVSGRAGDHAIGIRIESLVDRSRATAADGAVAGHPGRTLVTTVLYPAQGTASGPPVSGAPADKAGGPYPLIVFAHGFGSDVTSYLPLLEKWAGAGFVVAAVRFPDTDGSAVAAQHYVDTEADDMAIGMEVEVDFVEAEDVWLPVFRPVAGAAVTNAAAS